ncbi:MULTISPECIES: YeeE/YedE family protein [Acinetobacter]|uniref:YeeE/YedE family protein n=1 Tax=Acinetobacter TaxID=469 RepID=UPI0020C988E7|nr:MULTISPECIES: YeeE/YedE family protein [Acinetobacter]UTO21009.1 YeeE/YedE family protein [Acinetobacter sp. Z1]
MSSIILALVGGSILGISVVGYLYVNGRIAGISGLLAQVLQPKLLLNNPAFWFLSGLFIIPFIYQLFVEPEIVIKSSPLGLIIAGLLVGFGTRLGSGCTSGHGICGISRLSVRSIVATVTFMLAGIVTVFVIRHVLGAVI